MKIELDLDGEFEHVFEVVVENAHTADGDEPDAEDVAEAMLKRAAIQQYQQIVMG